MQQIHNCAYKSGFFLLQDFFSLVLEAPVVDGDLLIWVCSRSSLFKTRLEQNQNSILEFLSGEKNKFISD